MARAGGKGRKSALRTLLGRVKSAAEALKALKYYILVVQVVLACGCGTYVKVSATGIVISVGIIAISATGIVASAT
jgi:hypothetical protein